MVAQAREKGQKPTLSQASVVCMKKGTAAKRRCMLSHAHPKPAQRELCAHTCCCGKTNLRSLQTLVHRSADIGLSQFVPSMRLITFAGLLGGYLILWQTAQAYKGDVGKKQFIHDLERGSRSTTDLVTKHEYEKTQAAVNPAHRLLNVNAFSLATLDVSEAACHGDERWAPEIRALDCTLTATSLRDRFEVLLQGEPAPSNNMK